MSDYKNLSQELVSLFNLKKTKIRNEKILTQEAFEAQKDIRLLTMMFADGIPDVTFKVNDTESIKWQANTKQLLYIKGEDIQILDATAKEIRVRMRPFLSELVKKAKDFYSDD